MNLKILIYLIVAIFFASCSTYKAVQNGDTGINLSSKTNSSDQQPINQNLRNDENEQN